MKPFIKKGFNEKRIRFANYLSLSDYNQLKISMLLTALLSLPSPHFLLSGDIYNF